jgi:hypothetical protein
MKERGNGAEPGLSLEKRGGFNRQSGHRFHKLASFGAGHAVFFWFGRNARDRRVKARLRAARILLR